MESETTIIHPLHFMVVQKAGTSWIFSGKQCRLNNNRSIHRPASSTLFHTGELISENTPATVDDGGWG